MKAEQLIKLNATVGTSTTGHEHICSENQRIMDFILRSGERKAINFEEGLKSQLTGVLKAVACNDQDKNLSTRRRVVIFIPEGAERKRSPSKICISAANPAALTRGAIRIFSKL